MKFQIGQDFINSGWAVANLSGTKIHIHKERNQKELYTPPIQISEDCKIELDNLFGGKLQLIAPIIREMGVDYYALANKNYNTCIYATAEQRPYKYSTILFRFFGHFSEKQNKKEVAISIYHDNSDNIFYDVRIYKYSLHKDKLAIEIKFKEELKV